MALPQLSLQEYVRRVQADVKSKLPNLDPTLFNTITNALTVALGNRGYDFQLSLEQLDNELFPWSASSAYLDRWAAYEYLTRITATPSSGYINCFGDPGIVVNIDLELTNDGNTYTVTTGNTTTVNVISISDLSLVGSLVTATTSESHQLSSGQNLTISGANEAEYNGEYEITVLSETEFTYNISGSPATPATGTIIGTWNGAIITIQSNDSGLSYNLSSGAILTFSSAPTGISTNAYTQVTGLTGGGDLESDDALYIRILQSRANPVANFNPAAIEKECLAISGVTRVKVKRIYPEIGHVTVLFVRDNDDDIIPDTSEVLEVKTALDAIAPAEISLDNVHVLAPEAYTVDFTLTNVYPNNTGMQTAIRNALQDYFNNLEIEETVYEVDYISAINKAVDLVTGTEITDFEVALPIGDIAVGPLKIGVLGTVSFT